MDPVVETIQEDPEVLVVEVEEVVEVLLIVDHI